MNNGTNYPACGHGSGAQIAALGCAACLSNQRDAAEKEIAALKAELAKHQKSPFHPDWSLLRATRDSLRESGLEIAELRARGATLDELYRRVFDLSIAPEGDAERNLDAIRSLCVNATKALNPERSGK